MALAFANSSSWRATTALRVLFKTTCRSSRRIRVDFERISSGAPLQYATTFLSDVRCMLVIILRFESKGITAILGFLDKASSTLKSPFPAKTRKAPSVGSPSTLHREILSEGGFSFALCRTSQLQRAQGCAAFQSCSRAGPQFQRNPQANSHHP